MKKQIFIIAVLLGLVSLFLLWRSSSPVGTPKTEENRIAHSPNPPAATDKLAAKIKSLQSSAEQTNASQAQNPRTMDPAARQQFFSNQLNVPISFYGKVIDENSNAVPSAKVQFSWGVRSWPTGESRKQSSTTSDGQGLFLLEGAKGASLSVHVSKVGYYTARPGTESFGYSGANVFLPDSANPVIFKLRKKGQGASLIQVEIPPFPHISDLPSDGTPVEFDLLKGAQVSAGNGQLKLQFWRDRPDENARIYDWRLQLSIAGGGLVQTTEEYPFQAPQASYQPTITIDQPAKGEHWGPEIDAKYYIQFSDGNYGQIALHFQAFNGVFTIHSVVNPSGSRNLEPAN